MLQTAEEQLVGQRLAHRVLDEPLHGACPHQRIEALACQILAERVGEDHLHPLLVQRLFQLHQELVHHPQDDLLVQRTEADDGIQAVAELGREQPLDLGHLVARLARVRESDGTALQVGRPCVGGHDEHHVAEIGLASVVVGQRAVIHHLQQDVEDVRMRLLDLVEQQHRVRLLGDGLGQQPALIEADIARRRADQTRHGVPLHVLGHVEAHQLDAQREGQLPRHLGLAHTRGAREQERADGLLGPCQARARHLDGGRQCLDGRILPEHHVLQITLQVLQLAAVVTADRRGRDAGDLGDDGLDVGLADHFLGLVTRQHPLCGTRLVDHVDGLVGQMTIGDVLGRQFGRCRERRPGVADAVVLLEVALQAAQDLHGLFHRRLHHIDLLEAPRQRMILLEDATVLGERGGTNALELARRQRRLEQVGGIQRAARGRAGPDEGVDLVDEQDRLAVGPQLLEHRLQALLEVAAVLGAGQQRTHVQRIDGGVLEHLGRVALHDAPGQPFGNGSLANASLAHQQRIVLAPAHQHLDDALQLALAADQRVDPTLAGGCVEIGGVLLQRALGVGVASPLGRGLLRLVLARLLLLGLGDAVRDVVDHIQPGDALLMQVIDGVRILLAEDGDQHVGPRDLLLAVGGGLHVHDGPLDDPLEAQRGLRVDLFGARHHRGVFLDEARQALAQLVDVGGAGPQHFGRRWVVEQRQQQVLDGDEFVALLPGLDKGHVQADFQLLGDHASSITH